MLLDQKLSAVFGADRVFRSSRSIIGATPFAQEIVTASSSCAVMLPLIGPHWFRVDGKTGGRLIDDPGNWVRREIELALACQRPVLPVLVGDRPRLEENELPASIRELAGLQYTRFHHRSAERDLTNIADQVRAVLGPGIAGHAAPRPTSSTALTTLNPTTRSSDVYFGSAKINGSEYTSSIIYRSKYFANSSKGVISFNVGMSYRQLEVIVGVLDDAADSRQTGHFEVYADGVKRAHVTAVQKQPRVVTVDLTDVLNLQLVAYRTDVVGSPLMAGVNATSGVSNNLPELAWGDPLLHP